MQGSAPAHTFGTSNYVLQLVDDNEAMVPLANIYFFDSGGGSLQEMNDKSQVAWFRYKQSNVGLRVPSVAFQHIPTSNNDFAYKGKASCSGLAIDGGVSPVESDAGLFQALLDDESMRFLAVGHNHGNDYCCQYNGGIVNGNRNGDEMSICYGRHSGYGGYSTYLDGVKWAKGARVYILEYDSERQFTWSSYVRLEHGGIEDRFTALSNDGHI